MDIGGEDKGEDMGDETISMDTAENEFKLEIKAVESIKQEDAVDKSSSQQGDCVLEIKTVESLETPVTEEKSEMILVEIKKENLEGSERDLSKVEPNRDQEICTLQKIVIQNSEDKENVEKLSHELEKLKVIVLELTDYFPHYQPRTKEKVFLNTACRSKKELEEGDFAVFKTSLEDRQYNTELTNCGIENLFEILETVSSSFSLKEKIKKVIKNVSELCSKLIEYADHLKRKVERLNTKDGDTPEKYDDCERIGKKGVFITRRKNQYPIVGVAEKDMSPLRDSFNIKEIIGKVDPKKADKSKSRDRGSVSPIRNNFNVRKTIDSEASSEGGNSRNFSSHVKDLVVSIDRLRKNMIFGLRADDNFKLNSDWEFFTNMFKKEAMAWNKEEKLEHLETLVVEDHIAKKMGDPIWRFLESKYMTDDRIERIDKYNRTIEAKFDIKHEPPTYTAEQSLSTKKLKKGLFFVLNNDRSFEVSKETARILDLVSSFDFPSGNKTGGILKDETAQDTLDFLENDDLLPEPREEFDLLKKLDTAFLALTSALWALPEDKKTSFSQEISLNLEFESLRFEFLELAKNLKSQMKVLFEADDRYAATGDEKYYLDLPGKEGEKVFASDVKKFLKDFKADEMTKTLKSKYDKFYTEQNCDGLRSFNSKLKACVKNVNEKAKNCVVRVRSVSPQKKGDLKDEIPKGRRRKRSRSRRRITRSPARSRRSRSPPARRSDSFNKSPDRRRGRRMSPARNMSSAMSGRGGGPSLQPFQSNVNMGTNDVMAAASQLLGQMNPLSVLNMIGINPSDPRATSLLAAGGTGSPNMMGGSRNMMGTQQNIMGAQQNMMGAQQNMMGRQQNMNSGLNMVGGQQSGMGLQDRLMRNQQDLNNLNMPVRQQNIVRQQQSLMSGQSQNMMGRDQKMMSRGGQGMMGIQQNMGGPQNMQGDRTGMFSDQARGGEGFSSRNKVETSSSSIADLTRDPQTRRLQQLAGIHGEGGRGGGNQGRNVGDFRGTDMRGSDNMRMGDNVRGGVGMRGEMRGGDLLRGDQMRGNNMGGGVGEGMGGGNNMRSPVQMRLGDQMRGTSDYVRRGDQMRGEDQRYGESGKGDMDFQEDYGGQRQQFRQTMGSSSRATKSSQNLSQEFGLGSGRFEEERGRSGSTSTSSAGWGRSSALSQHDEGEGGQAWGRSNLPAALGRAPFTMGGGNGHGPQSVQPQQGTWSSRFGNREQPESKTRPSSFF